jgi:hypothetical protein
MLQEGARGIKQQTNLSIDVKSKGDMSLSNTEHSLVFHLQLGHPCSAISSTLNYTVKPVYYIHLHWGFYG